MSISSTMEGMTPEQIDAATRLVELVRQLAYGYKNSRDADVRQELMRTLSEVERLLPLRRRGLDGNWLTEEN